MNIRQNNWQLAENRKFDAVILGGGINGATLYNRLCARGYTVLLLDKGDFSSGTSQASAMMIWGGLLYLKNLDFFSVYNFSMDRDNLIRTHGNEVDPVFFRYIPNREWGRNRHVVHLALYLYWIMGRFHRQKPSFQKTFEELQFLCQKNPEGSLLYQEGFLKDSDSRFVLDWILSHQTENSFALNYCTPVSTRYNGRDKEWTVDIADTMTSSQCSVKTKIILNCAGVWTDSVNRQFGIQSPYRHVMSKGVFISFKRPETHHSPLIFEMGVNGDTLSFIPWGPVSLWGPTETMEDSIENGFSITPGDIHFLLDHASRNLASSLVDSQIISLRCGIRPLAVGKNFKADCYPLDISRYHKIADDRSLPWITVYGGKISGCITMAENVVKKIGQKVPPSMQHSEAARSRKKNPANHCLFPGLAENLPTVNWCVDNEFCCTLEDYLRRRTNVSQWVPREGLGFNNENMGHIENMAGSLPDYGSKTAVMHVNEYVTRVNERFDRLMEQI